MLVEKCKRVMMEERRGRGRARRMAREVAGVMTNPIGTVSNLAGGAMESIVGEEMSGGAKVLLLLAVAGAVGGGIYYFTVVKPASTATTTPPVAPNTVNPNAGGTGPTLNSIVPGSPGAGLTYAQEAALAAQFSGTTLAAWQANGVPSAVYSQLSPGAQQGLAMYGVRVV